MTEYLTDRTSIETDETCGTKYWWYKFHNGTGIVPTEQASYFKAGRELHADFAALTLGKGPDEIVRRIISSVDEIQPFPYQAALEQAWWHAGMVAAFARFILPRRLRYFTPLLVEKELVLDRSPLKIANTADVVWSGIKGGPTDGVVLVDDYKSVSTLGKGWTEHWPYAVQMQINPKAVEEELGVKVKALYVIGVQKGQFREGKLRHPYVWAYSNGEKWQHDWAKEPYALRPRWEVGEGLDSRVAAVLGWVDSLGEGVASGLFPISAPVFENERLLNSLIKVRTQREAEIASVKDQCQTDEDLRDHYFPPAFSHCRPTMGDQCPYLAACHNAEVHADPVGSGAYVPRTPHHDLESLTRESE